ncbi:hypothetical protein SLE2022_316380 [Rubroshorea leprosula]
MTVGNSKRNILVQYLEMFHNKKLITTLKCFGAARTKVAMAAAKASTTGYEEESDATNPEKWFILGPLEEGDPKPLEELFHTLHFFFPLSTSFFCKHYLK